MGVCHVVGTKYPIRSFGQQMKRRLPTLTKKLMAAKHIQDTRWIWESEENRTNLPLPFPFIPSFNNEDIPAEGRFPGLALSSLIPAPRHSRLDSDDGCGYACQFLSQGKKLSRYLTIIRGSLCKLCNQASNCSSARVRPSSSDSRNPGRMQKCKDYKRCRLAMKVETADAATLIFTLRFKLLWVRLLMTLAWQRFGRIFISFQSRCAKIFLPRSLPQRKWHILPKEGYSYGTVWENWSPFTKDLENKFKAKKNTVTFKLAWMTFFKRKKNQTNQLQLCVERESLRSLVGRGWCVYVLGHI